MTINNVYMTRLGVYSNYFIKFVKCWEVKTRLNLGGCRELDKFIVLDN